MCGRNHSAPAKKTIAGWTPTPKLQTNCKWAASSNGTFSGTVCGGP